MKKVILVAVLFLGLSQVAQSQIQFGIKGGVNYNSDSFSNVVDDVLGGASSKTGFHAGVWTRFKIPVIGIQLRPELVYTQLSNDVTYTAKGTTTSVNTSYDLKKFDIPILVEKKVFGVGRVFAGPSFQFITGADFGINTLDEVKLSEFTMGLQLGAGVELGKIGLDVRWERGLSKIESFFVDSTLAANDQNVNFDSRINQIIVGLSYRF